MFKVYCIYNSYHKKLYVGQTKDINERKELHNSHIFKNSYTARFDGEWKIIYSETVESREAALRREKQLKSFRGREFLKTFIRP
ncbi:hypothetical protein A2755_02915 [Candidatus Wolfebacteria bacterium RIFCSPHIGHO2_01_FULL_48_22]|uniref:GIY-YIG domain-containing protein n=2 Tax=Candidatus Wolfeibacteriota TaxID=1752735 RepID=A0A1F8DU18_9BACT|nr:MAG: hypothetical protein A2755_02915 [Candidatus Wolfebacteria bacterium RIFCSPHIGHO2_01_FULL_48_22]OGM92183.1 MAG: hypothetical protein A2935_00150 [Candidatus Wolfebacteria bacterium RIFCSPLOWO2_01_FULL_47_17b]